MIRVWIPLTHMELKHNLRFLTISIITLKIIQNETLAQ
jgi:hypothetical protein